MSRLIVGITGTLGAGKGAVVDHLTSKHGFLHFSARAFLTEEVRARGLPLSRDSLVKVRSPAGHAPSAAPRPPSMRAGGE